MTRDKFKMKSYRLLLLFYKRHWKLPLLKSDQNIIPPNTERWVGSYLITETMRSFKKNFLLMVKQSVKPEVLPVLNAIFFLKSADDYV